MTSSEEFLQLVVQPITDRLGRLEGKLDQALQAQEQIAVQAAAQARTDTRLKSLEDNDAAKAIQLAKAEGRNAIINWILGLLGAPLVVAVAGAGILKVLGVTP